VQYRRLITALWLAGAIAGMAGTMENVHAGWTPGVQKNAAGDSIVYQLFVPSGYSAAKTYPVVITLHGVGERGTDNTKQISFFNLTSQFTNPPAQTRNACFVLAPQCSPNDQWVNVPYSDGTYNQDAAPLSTSLGLVAAILDSVQKKYTIDASRIYVVGLSMGGYGTWDLITRFPTRFAAASAACGAGDTSKARLIAHMPTWTYHTRDDPVVPFSGSQQMVEALTAAGGSPKFSTHDTGGHDAWIWAYADTSLSNWLFRQRNSSVGVSGPTHAFVSQASAVTRPTPSVEMTQDGNRLRLIVTRPGGCSTDLLGARERGTRASRPGRR
jgi:predicted peptidase